MHFFGPRRQVLGGGPGAPSEGTGGGSRGPRSPAEGPPGAWEAARDRWPDRGVPEGAPWRTPMPAAGDVLRRVPNPADHREAWCLGETPQW